MIRPRMSINNAGNDFIRGSRILRCIKIAPTIKDETRIETGRTICGNQIPAISNIADNILRAPTIKLNQEGNP